MPRTYVNDSAEAESAAQQRETDREDLADLAKRFISKMTLVGVFVHAESMAREDCPFFKDQADIDAWISGRATEITKALMEFIKQ